MTRILIVGSCAAAILASVVVSAAAHADIPLTTANGTVQSCATAVGGTQVPCHQLKDASGATINPATKEGIAAIVTTLGAPFQAGGSVGISGTPTFNIGTGGAGTSANPLYVTGGSSALPTGAATSANQATELASLVSITTNTGTSAANSAANAAYNAPFGGAVALTVGTAVSGASIGRSLALICTATGNVSLTFSDASTLVVPVAATGLTILPFAVTTVNSSGTTATCTYANLK